MSPRKKARSDTPVESALRAVIESSGMSAKKISEQTGVPQPTITRFLNRERTITLPNVDRLAAFFGFEIRVT